MEDNDIPTTRTIREYLKDSLEVVDVFKWLLKTVVTKESKRHLNTLFACLFLNVILVSVQPSAVGYIFDGVKVHDQHMTLIGLVGFVLSLIVLKTLQRFYDRAREYVLGLHMGKLDEVTAKLFFEKSMSQHAALAHILSPSSIDKGKWKALDMQRMVLFDGLGVILQLTLSICFLYILNGICGLIMTLVFLVYVLGSMYLNSVIANSCGPLDKRFRALYRRRSERFDAVERVHATGMGSYEVGAMAAIFDPLIKDDRKFWLWFIDAALVRSAVNVIGLSVAVSYGVWLVWNGEISIGLLYPLFTWSYRVSDNIWRLADVEHQINWNMPAVKSMIRALSIPPDIVDAPDAVEIDGTHAHEIVFQDVSHVYPKESGNTDEPPPAVKRVSFSIHKGERVSLLGPSGAGKTTLMRLLLRYGDPTSGQILVDGVPLTHIKLQSWRKGIGYIAQQPRVLDGTIRYNLVYGLSLEERERVTDEELWELMRLLKIDFGERLINGLDTVVGKNGVKLSGGQAQRLMIGAAVIKKPWLLIVDEATSSLDSTTEKEVQEGLDMILKDRGISALVIAHRLSTVRKTCNKHVILKAAATVSDGETQVDATGTSFEELLETSAIFRQLATDQDLRF
jgi:ABC-type multidrug transport system fused ATPase/permease subunit